MCGASRRAGACTGTRKVRHPVLMARTLLEKDRFPVATVEALQARGHIVEQADLNSGLQAIQRTPRGWHGGADPRREGVVRGD